MLKTLAMICVLLAGWVGWLDYKHASESSMIELRPAGQYWHNIHSESLQLTEAGISRYVSPSLWSGIQYILQQPMLIVLLVLALIFFGLHLISPAQRRRRQVDMIIQE